MPYPFSFEVEAERDGARAGVLTTPHGRIPTPAFMPVATQAAVKLLSPDELIAAGTSILVANTYHLHLRPGEDVVAGHGGLHEFMAWPGAILTDSGGFQIHSLASRRELDDDGVTFRSHVDGQLLRLTPEIATRIQEDLGADLIMAFDYCTSYPTGREEAARAVDLTTAWAERCLRAHGSPHQRLLGIVQGAVFRDLRERSAAALVDMGFFAYAIGGLSVGEDPAQTAEYAAFTASLLPRHKLRYLMGVGRPEDMTRAVAAGIDLFDCVVPTREARHGTAITPEGRMNLRRAEFRADERPVDENCSCYTCRRFSRAYLRHLLMAGEHSAGRLLSLHNIYFLQHTLACLRARITGENV
ncbi:MAG: tRNA guanosine(34) transglycosylase Tgt [Candidatus Zixiibacteriota bacterium]|jgi:queuine tRNA-ribosyltransferase